MRASKEMQQKMRDFLAGYDERKVTYGVDDCTMFAREWVKVAKGIEVPFIPVGNRKQAYELIREKGGLETLWSEALGKAGIPVGHDKPQFGDIGLIDTRDHGPIGAIFAHGGLGAVRELSGGWRWFSPRTVQAYWDLQC